MQKIKLCIAIVLLSMGISERIYETRRFSVQNTRKRKSNEGW
jgi:hypothetical protein